MSITVQTIINWARTHTKLQPLVGIGGFSNEPGLTIANDVKMKIINSPYSWKWNRATHPSFLNNTTTNTEDYIILTNDIGWIERAYWEEEAVTSTPKPRHLLETVHQLLPGEAVGDPMKVAVEKNQYGTDVFRFYPIPDIVSRRFFIDYQKKCELMDALTDNFDPIPDDMQSVIRELFLAFALRLLDDKRAYSAMQNAERVLADLSGYHDAEQAKHEMIVPERSLFLG